MLTLAQTFWSKVMPMGKRHRRTKPANRNRIQLWCLQGLAPNTAATMLVALATGPLAGWMMALWKTAEGNFSLVALVDLWLYSKQQRDGKLINRRQVLLSGTHLFFHLLISGLICSNCDWINLLIYFFFAPADCFSNWDLDYYTSIFRL